jgi:hypothetical protein
MPLIDNETCIVASTRQLSTTLGNDVVILGLNDGVYYGLDGVGTRLWDLLQAPRIFTELVDALLQEYDVTRERLEQDVRALLETLCERGLVAIAPHPKC